VQKESAAMETTAFTWIINQKVGKRDTWLGPATLKHFPYLEGIDSAFEKLTENLRTEIVPSTEHNFHNIELIDTPGLTDGDLVYPYDVNAILTWIAHKVDLVFVFFDPHGQALCKRTKDVVDGTYVSLALSADRCTSNLEIKSNFKSCVVSAAITKSGNKIKMHYCA
jgi:hypothetical protein